jgi:uncharacterized protein YcbK (DUF882 family)
MLDRSNPHPARRSARRRFLLGASAVCGVVGSMIAVPGLASAPSKPRSVRFVHTHTGETLTAPYFDGGGYNLACLTQVNYLLRDFRTGDIHSIDPSLLDVLYDLQTLADRDSAFEVISGYRSPATNAMLHRLSSGVAEHSQHLLGKAIDIRLQGYSTLALSQHARTLARGGVGYYQSSDFVHVDTGRVRFW